MHRFGGPYPKMENQVMRGVRFRVFTLDMNGSLCCIIGRPPSMNMGCPDDIGREVWDRVGRESVDCLDPNSPQELGEEALTEWSHVAYENGASPR